MDWTVFIDEMQYDYRQVTMSAEEYSAALFVDSVINHIYDFSEEA